VNDARFCVQFPILIYFICITAILLIVCGHNLTLRAFQGIFVCGRFLPTRIRESKLTCLNSTHKHFYTMIRSPSMRVAARIVKKTVNSSNLGISAADTGFVKATPLVTASKEGTKMDFKISGSLLSKLNKADVTSLTRSSGTGPQPLP